MVFVESKITWTHEMLVVDYLLLRSDRSCEIQAIKNSDRPLTLRA